MSCSKASKEVVAVVQMGQYYCLNQKLGQVSGDKGTGSRGWKNLHDQHTAAVISEREIPLSVTTLGHQMMMTQRSPLGNGEIKEGRGSSRNED